MSWKGFTISISNLSFPFLTSTYISWTQFPCVPFLVFPQENQELNVSFTEYLLSTFWILNIVPRSHW
jgi:hypothetical protein